MNEQLSQHLNEIANMHQLDGAPWKAVAFRKASRIITSVTYTITREGIGQLSSVKGLGPATIGAIQQYLESGSSDRAEELRDRHPAGLIELQKMRTVGPVRAKEIYFTFGIKSLKEAAEQTEYPDIAVLAKDAMKKRRLPWFKCLSAVQSILNYLDEHSFEYSLAGSMRRRSDDIGDVDILLNNASPDVSEFGEVIAQGDAKTSILIPISGQKLQVDFLRVHPKYWGSALNYFTGCKDYNIAVRNHCLAHDLGKLSEWGIDKGRITFATEEELYEYLQLPYVPPELREWGYLWQDGFDPKLRAVQDLHVHSNWSDGSASIMEIAQVAKELKLRKIAVCDHSYNLKKGAAALRRRERECRRAEKITGVKVLCGIEVDINMQGELAFDNLEDFDFVIGAIHRNHHTDAEERLMTAIESEKCDAIAHPTGRIIGERDPADINWPRVFKGCAKHEVKIELNGSPERLDLPFNKVESAQSFGCQFIVGTDMHYLDGWPRLLEYMKNHMYKSGILYEGGIYK